MRTLLALALLAHSGLALSAGSYPWYFGLRVGDDMEKRLPEGPGGVDTERPFSPYFGYRFNDWFGIEGSYIDLGRSERSGIADAGYNIDGQMYTVGGTLQTEVAKDFSLFGGLGGFRLDEDGDFFGIAGRVPVDLDDSGFYAEAGMRYTFQKLFAVRASYAYYDFDQDADGTPWLGMELSF